MHVHNQKYILPYISSKIRMFIMHFFFQRLPNLAAVPYRIFPIRSPHFVFLSFVHCVDLCCCCTLKIQNSFGCRRAYRHLNIVIFCAQTHSFKKIKTFWFCLFLFSKQNISYLSMLFHFQQTFASLNLFRNIIMIMHKSLHIFFLLRLYQVSLLFGIQTELSLFALNWKNLQSDHKFGSIYLLFCGLSMLYWASWLL